MTNAAKGIFAKARDLWLEMRGIVTPPPVPVVRYTPSVPDEEEEESGISPASATTATAGLETVRLSDHPQDDLSDAETEEEDRAPAWQAETITGRSFVIQYSDSKGRASERQIMCRSIAVNGDVTYLHAYCYVRNSVRMFRAERIVSVIDTETGEIHEPGASFLASFLPNTESKAPYRYGLSPQQFGDFNAALNVLAFMARCDGEWHELETEAIIDFAAAYWLRTEIIAPLDEVEVLRHISRLAPTGEVFWVSLHRCRENPVLAGIIRRHIAALIDADGQHHEKELYWGAAVDAFLTEDRIAA